MANQKKAHGLSRQLAGVLLFIGLVILIFNFFYARYSNVNMSSGIIIFFVFMLIWYISAVKIAKRTEPIALIDKLGGRGERILKKNLQRDEILIAKLKGSFGEAFVITNHNVYVVKWGFMAGQFFGGRCNCYPYQRIVGIECKKGLATGTVEVLTAANQNIKGISYWGLGSRSAAQSDNAISFFNNDYERFQEAVNRARKFMVDGKQTTEYGKKGDLDHLEKLAELKDKGIITNEEFNAKKKMILGL
jgi:hypothetical protein